jgi:hypothetical protein
MLPCRSRPCAGSSALLRPYRKPPTRGVVPSAPGLYFIGLPFLYSINSSLVVGVGDDAAYLADMIVCRAVNG